MFKIFCLACTKNVVKWKVRQTSRYMSNNVNIETMVKFWNQINVT